MGKEVFEASLAKGPHHRLAQMAGDWEGTFRLWFQPGEPACEAAQRGRIRAVLGGRFLLHEYQSHFNDEPIDGIALYGHHLDDNEWQAAWAETFGTGTQLMLCSGPGDDPRLSVLGSYGDGQGGPRWGWRTQLDQPDPDTLIITMTNISPAGEEAKAVETHYRRVT